MAATYRPGRHTQSSPAQRPQASTAPRAYRRRPYAAVVTAGGAIAAFATAAAILVAPTAAAKDGEYVQVCTGPHDVTTASCQPRAVQHVPLGGATPDGCHRTGPVTTACGRAFPHRHPSDADGGATLGLSGGATLAVSGGAGSTITSPQSGTGPNVTGSPELSPTHIHSLHATSHR